MESIRSFCYIRGKSSLFVLANTLSIVSFILFLQLNTEHSFLSALPFVCFYTMRLFGIFFIKQSKYVVSSVTIEWLALVLGSVGMGVAMLGEVFFFFYVLASILIGLSASWLSAANLTINHYQPNKEVSMQYRFLIVSVLLILGSLSLASPWRLQVTFFMYLCLYLLAFSYLRVAMDSQLILRTTTREINTLISKKESRLFLGIWGLLFLLRVGRALGSIRSGNRMGISRIWTVFYVVFASNKSAPSDIESSDAGQSPVLYERCTGELFDSLWGNLQRSTLWPRSHRYSFVSTLCDRDD